jgi:hypothetical protein
MKGLEKAYENKNVNKMMTKRNVTSLSRLK